MKSLKVILSMVLLVFASQAINAQRSRSTVNQGQPDRVEKKQLESDAKKLEHHELKAEKKMNKKSRKANGMRSDGDKTKSKAKVDTSRKDRNKVKARKGSSKLHKKRGASRKGKSTLHAKNTSKTQKNKHKKNPRFKAGKE